LAVGEVIRRAALALAVLGLTAGPAAAAASASAHAAPLITEPDLATARVVAAPMGGPLATVASIPYEGGPVLHHNRTHVIFWQPAGSQLTYDPGYMALIDQFLGDVAADSHSTAVELGITGQYTDGGGPAAYASTFAGSVMDTDPLPANGCTEPLLTGPPGWDVCLTDAQLQSEIEDVVAADHLPTTSYDIYFLVTPRGLGDCSDASSSSCALGGSANGYCGYHSVTEGGLLYAVIPYNAVPGHCQSTNPRPNSSTADPALSTISHEEAETVTDPLGDAWIDSAGNEIADVCITNYGPALGGAGPTRWDETYNGHHYWLQELFSRIQDACEPRPQPDAVSISGDGRVVAGVPLVLSAHAAQPGGTIAAENWSFGDGHYGRGRSVTHAFTHPGPETVTLRATDSAGNWAYATKTVTVTPLPARDRAKKRHRRSKRTTGGRS
jgi:hypothetical protein